MRLPIVALKNLVILPNMLIHFDLREGAGLEAVKRAMLLTQRVFLVMQMNDDEDEITTEEQLESFGTIAKITQLIELPNKVTRVCVVGDARARLLSFNMTNPYLEGELEERPYLEDILDPIKEEAMLRTFKEHIVEYSHLTNAFSDAILSQILEIPDLNELLDQVTVRMPFSARARQDVLDTDSTNTRFIMILSYMHSESEVAQIRTEIDHKVKERLDKNQKEYVLHEQMKEIQKELGEDETSDADAFEAELKKLRAPKEIKDKIQKEIKRFRMIASGSQEGTVSRTYIETLLDMPWEKKSKDSGDIKRAEEILNEDHYGMEKIKERILEYLAVRIIKGESSGQILCLVGPPGTGKTSIARSVARALNKKYIRVSLGGVRDEAEIRGHRRTYIGAMPGRIANGLKSAGVCNPLMLLDEIDKTSSDYKGDIASALLEVLDSEQNVRFSDHYIEAPVDLSHVMFIATANTTETIPGPLLDRMDVIEVSSYTENEKFHIAKDYLVGKQLKKNGLSEKQLAFSDGALKKIIHNYTREAGVRSLERRIGDICRKSARELLSTGKKQIKINEKSVLEMLGREKVLFDKAEKKSQVGIARGLAWTSVGGDTLEIEVGVMPGKGELILTGSLGDVMKESARAGETFIRSIGKQYKISDDFFEKHDIHIHIPEGAVPKDGPSAGITMASAILSAATGRALRADTAMTGEITLRGRVLPVGGLKEKLLAAKLADIKHVIVPEKNKPDIEELSEEITGGMEIHYAASMKDVIALALEAK